MPKVKLISNNAALVVGGIRLTKESPIADVSAELAAKFVDTGDAIALCEADENGRPIDPPFSDDEVMDVTPDGDPVVSADDTPDNAQVGQVVEADLAPLTAEMVQAASTKGDLIALGEEYGINLSACSNNDERRATLIASIAQ